MKWGGNVVPAQVSFVVKILEVQAVNMVKINRYLVGLKNIL